jgi:hypothetical protein
MFERFPRRTLAATGAAFLAAMGIGGAAIAQSNGSQPAKTQASPAAARSSEKPGVESTAPENSANDGDNVQYTAPGDPDYKGGRKGAQTVAANSGSSATSGSSQSGTSGQSGPSTAEAPGTEQSPASEKSGSESSGGEKAGNEKPGSEVPGDDGPGGHADEPANANADHQFEGQE